MAKKNLSENFFIRPLAVVIQEQLSRGQADGRIGKVKQGSNPGSFFLIDDLPGHLPDEIGRKRRLFDYVLRRVGLP